MLAFVYNFLLLFSEAAHPAGEKGGWANFLDFWNKYFNYPGFELWKFINLAIFVAVLVYLLRKPLGDAFKATRDKIRAELIRAEEEKKAAMARLTSAEAKLASLDNERQLVLNKAKKEADIETARILEHTDDEVGKLREQAESEIVRLTSIATIDLKRFSAEESIRLAEEKLRSKVDANVDAGLVRSGIQAIGGLN